MEIYKSRQQEFEIEYKKVRSRYKLLGAFRLLIFLGIVYSFYLSVSQADSSYLYFVGGLLVVFLILLKVHSNLNWKLRYVEALKNINVDEISFLESDKRDFEDGNEFHEVDHPYAYDLDIFGTKSLFQYLNRTASFIGKEKLSLLLKKQLSSKSIKENQEAVAELAQKVAWRQEINAYSKISHLDINAHQKLKRWANTEVVLFSKLSTVLAFLIPVLLLFTIVMYYLDSTNILWGYLTSALFSLNLVLALSKIKMIQAEIGGADKVHETINSYSEIISKVEKEDFKSEKILSYLKELKKDTFKASAELKSLSGYFEQLETVANIFVMIVFNGFVQYHVHVLRKFLIWKKDKAHLVELTINMIGEIEALNSLANFSYNNPQYVFPELSTDQKMNFTNLGHPLLNAKKRVCNDIDFTHQRFVILTGSNMSGKSTFLRTVGVNMVLAGMGAPVCATSATFFPIPLFVSMRLTDSLEDSESYFYAEVKRLQMIIEKVQSQTCFVLLDEILRGTNSDDKQSGTIGVILKLIREKTFGLIATHDLEVCNTTNSYPDILINKCFEVEIRESDLHFDYKIRDGVCQNKNATFIMKKMQIID
ncbi:MAG: DNA mismatch repair protein MutS [Flavobacteriaceae bacterium]|jgi:DNA mismatch repair ATPase MutS|nr:DNA mismatch repair protein MutS [Flavobacteriaceae bacterium]